MFDKRVMLVAICLLFILQFSFVSAVENNESDNIVEIDDNFILHVDNNTYNDYNCQSDNCLLENNSLEFNQGDKIHITIDSPENGNLTVLIDDENYGSWNFSKSETILIPTYNPSSFYNDSIKNINLGNHKFSLKFNLNSPSNYIPVISNSGSGLNFQFNKYGDIIMNENYNYTFVSTLKINKKDKSISVFPDIEPRYYTSGVGFSIRLYNLDLMDIGKNQPISSFGFWVSDNEKILLKKIVSLNEAISVEYTFDDDGVPCSHYDFNWYEVPGIDHDIDCKLGICNLTVINFADGATDSFFFNVSKFDPYIDGIDCVVNGTNVTFNFYFWIFPTVIISVDNLHKSFSLVYDKLKVTFVDLSSGVHVMTAYSPETDFSNEFLYNLTFKIDRHKNIVEDNNIILEFYDNITSFNFLDRNNITIFDMFLFNSSYGILNMNLINKKLNIGNLNINYDLTDESISVGDGCKVGGIYLQYSNVKSCEILKKSVSKSADNLLTNLGLIIVSCMALMVGYIRFNENR